MLSDIGIGLEMLGFFLFLVSATSPPGRGGVAYNTGEKSKWRFFYWNIPGENSSQVARVLGIGLILIGLILQICYFSKL